MQLALNLMSEEKLLKLLDDAEDEDDDAGREEEEEEANPDAPDGLAIPGKDRSSDELEHLIMLLAADAPNSDKKNAASDSGKKAESGIKKDRTIKDIIDRINRKFGRKSRDAGKDAIKRSQYLKEEFFSKNQYGLNISELFGYLNTRSATDIYKAFYNQGKDKIYNFEDEMLSKEQHEKIVKMTKLARYMGYKGDTEYCTHEQIDAHTREKWALIRNICYVFTLTMLRYEMSLS